MPPGFAPPVRRPGQRVPAGPSLGATHGSVNALAGRAPPIVHDVLRKEGQPLDRAALDRIGPGAGFDLSRVRVHTDGTAAESARAVSAAAYTVGRHVVFDAGEFNPHTLSGRDLLRHEMMHVMQQRSATGDGALPVGASDSPLEHEPSLVAPHLLLQRRPRQGTDPQVQKALPTSLAEYPEAERTGIRLLELLPGNIDEIIADTFDPEKAARYDTDADTRIVFGSTVNATFHVPLDSLANYLVGLSPERLLLNETVTVPVAPMRQAVRFTYFAHGKGKKVILVEAVGPVRRSDGRGGEALATAKHFTFGPGWTETQKLKVFEALTLISPSALNDKLKFLRAPTPKVPGEAALYDPNIHAVTVFDVFFDESPAQAGQTLLHELGHAADNQPVLNATAVFDASPKTSADQRRLEAVPALSGGDRDPGDFNIEFRQAARKDGIAPDNSNPPRLNKLHQKMTLRGSPTEYGDTNWKELFAETFAIYTSDPQLLQAIRPHVHAYFLARYPAPVTPNP